MFLILFGVTGVGKTTVGLQLAAQLGWKFYDADNFHPPANVDKMTRGIPLTDEDRVPWLESLRAQIERNLQAGEPAVLACSALKEEYRQQLQVDDRVKLVYLKGDFEMIQQRLQARRGHFMNPTLLHSQFETLEEPPPQQEGVFVVDASPPPNEVVHSIRAALNI